MTIWLREIAGWALMAIGLLVFYECYEILVPPPVKVGPDSQVFQPPGKILEGAELALVGIIVFRGGIGLLKSALAARVCAPHNEPIRAEKRAPAPLTGRLLQRG
ncbi:MAG: hypothetical protein ACJ8FY_23100 [Gemmataceae bacterium]